MTKSDLPANFLIYLNNGTLDVKCDDEPSINFSSKGNIRTIDIFDIPLKMSKKPGLIKQLSEAKHMAKRLREEKVTLDVKYKGELVLRLGEKANPKLARIVTLSKDIEITDLKKLKDLGSKI